MKRQRQLLAAIALACGIGASSPAAAENAASSASANQPVVRIGSKSATESVILGEILTHLARYAGAAAEHRDELGGTQIVFQALTKGDIDIYPDYTGTISQEILHGENVRSEDDMRAALAAKGIKLGPRLGFNNTYALGMPDTLATQLGITTISDLAARKEEPAIRQLQCGFSDEFLHRNDGWPGLKRTYNLPYEPVGMDHNLAYRGILQGAIQLTDLYSTDAEVRVYKLRLLDDDRAYFPLYYCVLLYRAELEDRAPAVLKAMFALENRINSDAMIEMNARAKIDRVPETRVAADFLREKLAIPIVVPTEVRWKRVLREFWVNTRRHLYLVGVSLAAAVVVAVPLGIYAYRRPRLGHAILGSVGIVQTIPSMAVLVFLVPLLGLGAGPAIVALFLYSLLPIVRSTFAGLSQIPGNLKESATALGLSPRARLWLIELPMASPSILSGIKTAAVINVGTATIGGLIGAGGYGEPILTGIRLASVPLLLEGAIPAALLALVVQGLFELAERLIVPRGLRIAAGKAK